MELIPDTEVCADCGGRLRRIGEDGEAITPLLQAMAERGAGIRAGRSASFSDRWQSRRHHREPDRAAAADLRPARERFVQAPLPWRPIERGRPGPRLLAHVLVSR